MTKNHHHHLEPLPAPYQHLVSALDQYYGIASPSENELEGNEKRCKAPSKIPSLNALSISCRPKQLRILITTFWEYPFVGGLQNYIAALKAGLEEMGHHVDVLASNHFPKNKNENLGRKIAVFNKQFYLNRYGGYNEKILNNTCELLLYEIMLKNINLDQYDIIHAQDRFTANVMGRLNQPYQKPLLFTPHGFMTHNRLKFGLIQRGSVEEAFFSSIDRQAIKNASKVVILCEVFRPILKNLGAADSKMTTVYTGIDFAALKKTEKMEDKTVITCVSRLRPRKGHKYFFEALALIKSELKNVEVRIVGEGVMREELEKLAQDLQLDNVLFLGSRNDIPQLLNESDIFVLPTTSDTLPISIIEAMFAGQAILTTNCGGIPEIIFDGHSGFIAEPGNSDELAEKLLLLLQDVPLRIKLAENAQAYAEQHLTIANMVKKIEEVYQSLN